MTELEESVAASGVSATVPLLADVEAEEWEREEITSATSQLKKPASPTIPTDGRREASTISEVTVPRSPGRIPRNDEAESSPTSHERWSMSDDVPLLADTVETVIQDEEAPNPGAPKKEKKPLISAERKIAMSHFLVRIINSRTDAAYH